MANFSTVIEVADVTALKALNPSNNQKRWLVDRGDGVGGWYRYDATNTETESLPFIITPDLGVGRWVYTSENPEVADITALKAVTSTVDGVLRIAVDVGNGRPGLYRYSLTATSTENLPDIVAPNSGTGRWFLMGGTSSSGGGGGDISVYYFANGDAPHINAVAPLNVGENYLYLKASTVYGGGSSYNVTHVYGIDTAGTMGVSGWFFGPLLTVTDPVI